MHIGCLHPKQPPCFFTLIYFSLFFFISLFYFSHRRLVDSDSSSPDPLQGGRRHASAHLRGVSDHAAAHSLIGGLVPAVPGGRGGPASGARHLVEGLRSALWWTLPAEDGGGGPQAGQDQRHRLQVDHSQAAARGPGPALLPSRRVDPGRRRQLVRHDPQAE